MEGLSGNSGLRLRDRRTESLFGSLTGGQHVPIQIPELLTVREVAAILKTSEDTVVRRFENLKGVIDIGQKASRYGRPYRQLRIPADVLQRFLISSQVAV